MQHLDEGTVHAWLDGALPPAQAADVERHARTCAECSALVADARGVIAGAARIVAALDDVPGGVIPARQAPVSTRSLWRTLHLTPFRAALAASVMVAVASLLVVRHAPENSAVDTALIAGSSAGPPTRTPVPTDKILKETKATPPAPTPIAETPSAVAPPASPPPALAAAAAGRSKSLAETTAEPTRVAAADSSSTRAADERVRAGAPAPVVASSVPANNPAAAGGAASKENLVERDAALRRELDRRPALSLVAASADDRPIEAPGCYQLVHDSVAVSPQIPERFSLDFAKEAGVRRNIVRAVNPAGLRDSIVAGITWRLVPGSTRFVLIGNESSPLPAAAFRSATAQAAPAARAGAVAGILDGSSLRSAGTQARITRVDCR